MTRQLLDLIDELRRRDDRLRLRRGLSLAWLALAAGGAGVLLAPAVQPWHLGVALPVLCVLAAMAYLVVRVVCDRRSLSRLAAARAIEARHGDLKNRLITAVELIESRPAGELGYLEGQVVREALDHANHHDWLASASAAPAAQARRWAAAHTLAGLALAAVLAAMIVQSRPFDPRVASDDPIAAPLATAADAPNAMTIEPGDVEVERGSSLIVTARFARRLPASATLLIDEGGGKARAVPMAASLSDPIAGARLPSVAADLTYRVAADGVETSRAFRVAVFDFPELLRSDATLHFPSYTGMADKTIEDTRHISGVEGTQASWTFRLNKPVASAVLRGEDGAEIAMKADAASPAMMTATMVLDQTRRYRVLLVDEKGRKNKHPVELVATALPNRPPELVNVFPRRDVRVSPLEEQLVQATAQDDYGLKAAGVTFSMAGGEPVELTLGRDLPAKVKHAQSHLLAFEAMGAQPDQLLSYYFWAEDVGPDGQLRRVDGDMYFAEVRHFEEIFREGQQPPQSQQQQQQQQPQSQRGQQIGEAIKSQREIITATWNLIRRETQPQPTVKFADDAAVVLESQAAALEKIVKLKEGTDDAESLEHVEAVERFMTEAIKHLKNAADDGRPSALRLALPQEQGAYQALLKLLAREHEVIRAQQQRSQQSAQRQQQQQAGPSQQQLDQLELKQEENRYETQKLAQDQQEDPAKRETRQALNRLRELAARQQDLNEKLKEVELALQEARTQQERENLERQLKRLREQQEEMLRDLDELRNRMEQPQNAQAMEQAKQQVDEARRNVREAAEALEKGMTSKALNEGTRAERKLEELREDFRRKAAGQFADDVKQMRQQARELSQKQDELGNKLDELNKQGPRTLRDQGERKAVADGLEQQKEKLGGLLDQVRKTSEESEAGEPLLSKQLYDTLRKAEQQKIDQALEVSLLLVDKGLNEEAKQVEPQARKGIGELKKGVEKAAESVLGDEAEALRRARAALDRLARDVQNEADAKDPAGRQLADNRKPGQEGESQQGEPQQGQPQQGQPQQGQPQQGQPQQAQPQQGQPQQGQPQQGQPQQGQPQQGQPQQGQPQQGQPQQGQPQQGQPQQGQPQQGQPQQGQPQQGRPQQGQPQQSQPQQGQPRPTPNFLNQQAQSSTGTGPHGPITGEEFRDWSDTLRDVEEMIDNPKLREEAARIRDRAKAMRAEFKRHGKEPQWDDVRKLIAQPLTELRDKVADELARRDDRKPFVPIDRDPVPSQFSDLVKKYYEKLGTGE